jgi:Fructose-bisphosphate aldolase class-I
MDGGHSLERCAEVTEAVLHEVFAALHRHRVIFELMLLKPSMVVAGKEQARQAPGCHGRDGDGGVMTWTIAPAVTLLLPYPIALQQRRPGPPTCRQDGSLHVGCCHASCRVDRTLERDHAVLAA